MTWWNKFLYKNINYGFWLLKREMTEKLKAKGFEFGDEEQKAINKAKELFLCGIEHLFFTLKGKNFELTLRNGCGESCWEIESTQDFITSVVVLSDPSKQLKFKIAIVDVTKLTEKKFEENEFDVEELEFGSF